MHTVDIGAILLVRSVARNLLVSSQCQHIRVYVWLASRVAFWYVCGSSCKELFVAEQES